MTAIFLLIVGIVFAFTLINNGNIWFLNICSVVGTVFFVVSYFHTNETMTIIWPIFIPFMFCSGLLQLIGEDY